MAAATRGGTLRHRSGPASGRFETDDDGRATVEGLEPGRYRWILTEAPTGILPRGSIDILAAGTIEIVASTAREVTLDFDEDLEGRWSVTTISAEGELLDWLRGNELPAVVRLAPGRHIVYVTGSRRRRGR